MGVKKNVVKYAGRTPIFGEIALKVAKFVNNTYICQIKNREYVR